MKDMRKGPVRSDPYCRKILSLCFNSSRTANFLSMKLNIPIAVCISKLNLLQRCGYLVRENKIRTSQGKWVQLYSSLVMEMDRENSGVDGEHVGSAEVEEVVP